MHKRKTIAFIMTVITFAVIMFSACKNDPLQKENYRQNDGSFSVHYLDVGQGDCALIYFPDGKTMLIDAGNGESNNNEYIHKFLQEFSVSKIDYLVLTHPDTDHVGGMESVVEKFQVCRAYVPHILEKENFPQFNQVYSSLLNKGVEIKISCTYQRVVTDDYIVAFLLPYPPDFSNSSYDNINKQYPTEHDINNVSPIIYVEYSGVKFLFTGDVDKSQENLLLDDEKVICNFFEKLGVNVNLSDVDFLKVAHHGSKDSTSERFLERINPKHAIISVGGENSYGLPSSQVLYSLSKTNPEHKLFRTDVSGTISVIVSKTGEITTVTDSK